MRPLWPILSSCLALACADEIPGLDPPGDEIYFPIGLRAIPDATGEPAHLVVLSSNFDQRFKSGMLTSYSLDALFGMADCAAKGQTEPCFEDSLRPAQTDTIRIFSFGGDVAYVPSETAGAGQIFVTARGRNRLTMINVDTGAEKLMTCSTPGAEIVTGSDCSRAYVVNTGFTDPFTLSYGRTTEGRDVIAIGHVFSQSQASISFGAVALADVQKFRQRAGIEAGVLPPPDDGELPEPVAVTVFPSFGGLSGVEFAGSIFGLDDVFLASNLRIAPDLLVAAMRPFPAEDGLQRLDLDLAAIDVLRMNAAIAATEMRGLAVAPGTASLPARAYGSVRFFARGDSYNAGLAVIDLTGSGLRVLRVLEVGEELQRPFLREVTVGGRTTRLAYVGDIRRDKIYVIDVTTDQPILVREIDGRTEREIEGEAVPVRLLDGPSQIEFVTRNDRTLGFVTNFSNSTMAVLDVTSLDPREHRLVARLGRNIDPEGQMEQP